MKKLNNYITEKLRINKDIDSEKDWSDIKREVKEMFNNEDSFMTLKFVLNLISRSKNEPYHQSTFGYWETISINKNQLTCEKIGWSRDGEGYRRLPYIEKCVKNYNSANGTDIKLNAAGVCANAGVDIMHIEEVVDALKKKYNDIKIDPNTELVSVY